MDPLTIIWAIFGIGFVIPASLAAITVLIAKWRPDGGWGVIWNSR